MKTLAVIPARMAASRFPGKPLVPLLGRPMIEHVYRGTQAAKRVDDVVVATCDEAIVKATEAFGGRAVLTSDKHERATDRVAEVAESMDADVYVMVQGDEPMVTPEMVDLAIGGMDDPNVDCVNLAAPIRSPAEFEDRNTIKVVMDRAGFALYFSREAIPTRARLDFAALPVFKQVCIIPFRRAFLKTYTALEPTPLEAAESIDMLRAMEHGYKVRLVRSDHVTHAVDTPEDAKRVEAMMAKALGTRVAE